MPLKDAQFCKHGHATLDNLYTHAYWNKAHTEKLTRTQCRTCTQISSRKSYREAHPFSPKKECLFQTDGIQHQLKRLDKDGFVWFCPSKDCRLLLVLPDLPEYYGFLTKTPRRIFREKDSLLFRQGKQTLKELFLAYPKEEIAY